MPRIYGYARASNDTQTEGPQIQAERIEQRARELETSGEGVFAEVLQEHESAERVPFTKRIQYRRLLDRMKAQDILIVCWLNRIERNALRMVAACEMLARRGVRLIELDSMFGGGGEMDLGTAAGRSMLLFHAQYVNHDSDMRSKASSAGLARAKRLGRPVSSSMPYGRSTITKSVDEYIWRDGGEVLHRNDRRYLIWDAPECQQIAELVSRYRAGEKMIDIATDWHTRNMRRTSGTKWVRLHKKNSQANPRSLYRAYKWAEEELRKNGTIGGIAMPPRPEPPLPPALDVD